MFRLGILSYVNCLPLCAGILTQSVSCQGRVVTGVPSELNARLAAGELDASLISTAEYLRNRQLYERIGDYCIGSRDGTLSVILLPRGPISELHKRPLALTQQSASSVALLKCLALHYWRIQPDYRALDSSTPVDMPRLIIGDDAIRNREEDDIDLAQAWYYATGLPFTFALLVARRGTHEEKRAAIEQLFAASWEWGKEHPRQVMDYAQKNWGFDLDFLSLYYRTLHYKADTSNWRGLEHFDHLWSQYDEHLLQKQS